MFDRVFILFLQVHGFLVVRQCETMSGHGLKQKTEVTGLKDRGYVLALESCNHISLCWLWSLVFALEFCILLLSLYSVHGSLESCK